MSGPEDRSGTWFVKTSEGFEPVETPREDDPYADDATGAFPGHVAEFLSLRESRRG